MEIFQERIIAHLNYWVYVVLMMIGLYAMIAKKLIGMSIFQTAIILFYVSVSVKADSENKHQVTIPILKKSDMPNKAHGHSKDGETVEVIHKISANDYENPLPHVLMLTAIVVGVATLGVGLAVVQKLYKQYDSIEEDEILAQIQADPHVEDAVKPGKYKNDQI